MPQDNHSSHFNDLIALSKSSSQHSPITPTTILSQTIMNGPLTLSYSTAHLSGDILNALQDLSDNCEVIPKFQSLLNGDIINASENRAVTHHHTRSTNRGQHGIEQDRAAAFAAEIRSSEITDVVQIGIGGSHLGPEFLYTALLPYAAHTNISTRRAHFISNMDADRTAQTLSTLDISRTLFIVASKSGGTQETLENYKYIMKWAKDQGISDMDFHSRCVSITQKDTGLDRPDTFRECFYMDEGIGGRFSATSVVGGLIVSLCFGPDIFEQVLAGAYEIDQASLSSNCRDNISLMGALISVWHHTVLGYKCKAIVPYSDALGLLPAHIQQLACESGGKSVSRDGKPLGYLTSPVVFGIIGTQAQHAFFQLLHQGTQIVPVQFIGLRQSFSKSDTMQVKLNANLTAQVVALSQGRVSDDGNQNFDGKRPSTVLVADQLTPEVAGGILAYYENMVMAEGFLLGINAFDQPGVELGKTLTAQLLGSNESSSRDSALQSLFEWLQG